MIKQDGKHGDINISRAALASLAGMAATSCYGVVGMSSRNVADEFTTLLKKENFEHGVRVDVINDKLQISLHITVLHGVNMKAICESIIHKVCYTMEEYSGFEVADVTVYIDGLRV